MNETLAKLHFWITFPGVYAIFMPMHFLGLVGHPRRYSSGENFEFLSPLRPVHYFITIAAFITIGAQLIFLFNFLWSLKRGKKAEINPWHATTLEWTVPSPPPHDNFAGQVPTVYRGPYEYAVPGAVDDYVPQHLAPEQVARAR
jgi:cytochrome c oxidase subunit I